MQDIQYGDIDYMDAAKDFTLDQVNFAGLPEYVQELKQQGTRFVIRERLLSLCFHFLGVDQSTRVRYVLYFIV